jgi:hypothetical protein
LAARDGLFGRGSNDGRNEAQDGGDGGELHFDSWDLDLEVMKSVKG